MVVRSHLLASFCSCVNLVYSHVKNNLVVQVNDYFDNQIGVDSDIRQPLVGGKVTMAFAKKSLYFIYEVLALFMTAVPGIPARLMVVIGNMLTYWYTKHLKPVTWLKNVVCASVMGISPATSGAAAFHLLSTENSFKVFGVSALSRLVTALFFGFIGREILMDINDVDNDAAHNVRTVPVAHGLKFSSTIAFLCTAAMATCAMMGPYFKIAKSLNGPVSWKALSSTFASSPGGATRQLIFAFLGCLPMLFRAWNVYKTEGEDRKLIDQAVNEGKLTFMLILASFI
jgi:4-hydroxybenzoate polyprenyltransferase